MKNTLTLFVALLFCSYNIKAQVIFQDGFEAGSLNAAWTPRPNLTGVNGIVEVTTASPFAGTYAARLGKSSDAGGFTTNALDLHLDLGGLTQAELSFWIYDFGDETQEFDGLYFSDDAGISFTKVFDFRPADWCNFYGDLPPFDIDRLAAANGLQLTSQFVIRFQQHDNADFNTFGDEDGIYLDSVRVVVPDLAYATLPFVDGFEAADFGPMWQVGFGDSTSIPASTNPNGLVRIVDNGGIDGGRGVQMGQICDGPVVTNALDLHVNLAGLSQAELSFWISDFSDETQEFDGLYFSDDAGISFTKVFDFRPADWCNFYGDLPPFDIDRLAAANGLQLTSQFVIRFQQHDNADFNTFGDEDGIYLDSVRVVVPDLAYATLPFADGFEAADFGPMWQVGFGDSTSIPASTNPNGLVRIVDNGGIDGGRGVQMGQICDGPVVTNALDLHVNLAGLSQAELSFWISDFSDETQEFDGLYFSDDAGISFTKVFDFRPADWCNFYGALPPFDIDRLAAANGLQLTSQFVIRFQQHDNADFNTFGDEDGIYLDSVRVVVPDLAYATLPFADGFEAADFGPMWQVGFGDSTSIPASTNPNGIVDIVQGQGTNNSNAVRIGKICDGLNTANALDLHLNLLGQSEIELSFWITDFADETQEFDGIYFSNNGGLDFTKVFQFTFGSVSGSQQYIVDVNDLALQNNLPLTSQFVIRFQQYDNADFNAFGDEDGIYLDDINITGTGTGSTWYADTDNDNFGDPDNSAQSQTQPTGFVSNSLDCDDTNPDINPDATEICDGLDNNCDGDIDEGVLSEFYPDVDGDGFGDGNVTPIEACSAPTGFAANNGDCDDTNPDVNPDAPEICDGIDNDCDGDIDGGVALTAYYPDTDEDGFGDENAIATFDCTAPSGFVDNNEDCNDSNPDINPDATEICDGLDNNCDGEIDEGLLTAFYPDIDGDGFGDGSVAPTLACTNPPNFVANNTDNCPDIANPGQEDTDGDGIGDACAPPPCPLGDLILTSQAEVDAFPANCSIIDGNLIINGDNITDLSNLLSIQQVTGSVIIGDTIQGNIGNDILTELAGLNNITTIGGDLIICQNPVLVSLNGFSSLTEVGGDILVKNCVALESFNLIFLNGVGGNITLFGLPSLINVGPFNFNFTSFGGTLIINGTGLTGLGGFGGWTFIGGDLFILNNLLLEQIDLPNLIQLIGCLHIINNTLVIDLGGLSDLTSIGGDIRIINMDEITNLDSLNNLTTVNGSLIISENDILENLDGLANLTQVLDSLVVTGNPALSECCGLFPLLSSTNLPSVIIIENNLAGCNSVADILATCTDTDSDGIPDVVDNCPNMANPDQTDGDSDGFGLACDCDDTNPDINPDAPEICDGIDNNCDGDIDGGTTLTAYYPDNDGDGFGDENATAIFDCAPPPGFVNNNLDCNDINADVFPNAPEICDGLDNNCDGNTDEGLQIAFYPDNDGDGFGDGSAFFILSCSPPIGTVTNADDCDDTNPDINPDAIEICDGIDNDCDGEIDEGVLSEFYPDADGDGFGDANADPTLACSTPPDFVNNNEDCDDSEASINPDAPEIMDGIDNNCNGIIDEPSGPVDCDEIEISTTGGELTITGLDLAPGAFVQIFDEAFNTLFQCYNNCGSSQGFNFGNGAFHVTVKYLESDGTTRCTVQEEVTITGGVDPGLGICGDIDYITSPSLLTIGNIDPDLLTEIQIFDLHWDSVFYCFQDCGIPASIPLPANSYQVLFKYFNPNYTLNCERLDTVIINDFLIAGGGRFEFGVTKYDEHCELLWTDRQGLNTVEYLVQKAASGSDFQTTETITAENGDSDLYRAYDLSPFEGKNRYRIGLRQVDGTVLFSEIKEVEFPVFPTYTIFPNPARDFAKIDLSRSMGRQAELIINNNLGQPVKQFSIDNISSKYFQIDLRDLREGYYWVWVNIEGRRAIAVPLMIGK